ncbi:hypothetical protein CMI37_38555 [Candidatus Pacearchaeota archaeon]|nr:hypothetical protein [Candidatus Pacearchaeota archaeon]
MKTRFDVNEYEWVHGAKPRGFGLWLFSSEDDWHRLPFTFEHTGLYSEAKKAAVAEFNRYRLRWNLRSDNSLNSLKVHA